VKNYGVQIKFHQATIDDEIAARLWKRLFPFVLELLQHIEIKNRRVTIFS
jgi:hypothetical protein